MKLMAYSFLSFLHVPSLILYTPFYSLLYPDVLPFLSPSTAAVIKASWPLFWSCHPLHFCVGGRGRIRIRKIYHQQLKASWVWDLFSHNLKRLWSNANRIQNTWRSGKTLKYKQECCKDKTKSGHLLASPKATSSCRWFTEEYEMWVREPVHGFLSRNAL